MRTLIQPLERRRLLAAVSFDAGGGNDLWSNPLNWSNDAVPTAADDVTVDILPTGNFYFGLSVGSPISVHSLTVGSSVRFSADVTIGTELRVKSSGRVLSDSNSAAVKGTGKLVVEMGGLWRGETPGPLSGKILVPVDNYGVMTLFGGRDIGPAFHNYGTVRAFEGGDFYGTFINEASGTLVAAWAPNYPGEPVGFGVTRNAAGVVTPTPFINRGTVYNGGLNGGGPGSGPTYYYGLRLQIYLDATPTLGGSWQSSNGPVSFASYGATPATFATDSTFTFVAGTLTLSNVHATLSGMANDTGLSVGRGAGAIVTIAQQRTSLTQLQIFDGNTVEFAPGAGRILRATDLGITSGAKLDITDGMFIDGNAPYIQTGYDFPAQQPPPAVVPGYADVLRSSLAGDVLTVSVAHPASTRGDRGVGFAVGAGLAALIPSSQILGETFDANDFIYRATIRGDANLDRTVNFADLVVLAQHYNGATSRGVADGNFDTPAAASTAVNFSDLVLLSQNYNQTLVVAASLIAPGGDFKTTPSKPRSGRLAELS